MPDRAPLNLAEILEEELRTLRPGGMLGFHTIEEVCSGWRTGSAIEDLAAHIEREYLRIGSPAV